MDSEQKRKINSLILELRALMEEELELVLKHYGVFLNRDWLDEDKLGFLSEEEKQIKKKLEIFIKRKEKIGINKEESAKEFIIEATYHWLNRILGLKCLESRDLIEEIITTNSDYGNRSYSHRNYLEGHPELKKSEDDGFFQCFYEILNKLTTEIQIIFDPNDIHMLIKPRIVVLKEVINQINDLEIEIYQNDEFLGWIYQYFHDNEREEIYNGLKKNKNKIKESDVIPLTQLYTEEYMIKFLAQNSLGALWMEMYPKSQLNKNWEFYVESPNEELRKVKDLNEIHIIDPACGSGHFLIYLFDMLYDMYLEEGKIEVKDIAKEIIEKNLFGIDIDTRAIQITALILYIKYKEKTVDDNSPIPRFNLLSTNIISYKTEFLNEFIDNFEGNKILKKLIITIWSNLKDIRNTGSLSKINDIIKKLIIEEVEQNRDGILSFANNHHKNWEDFKKKILAQLSIFLQNAIETFDVNKELFAQEEERGIWLIDAFQKKYDVVITNPPYLNTRNLKKDLKIIFKKLYPLSHLDYCMMFLEKSLSFLKRKGYAALITMQSFMFLISYTKLRAKFLDNANIEKVIHLGKRAFSDNTGAVLQTILIVFKKINLKDRIHESIFFDLTSFDTTNKKIENLINHNHRYIVNQKIFKNIQNYPFAYNISHTILDVFDRSDIFINIAPPKTGISTSDNDRFLRYWWEINNKKIAKYGTIEKKKWHFYAKGGVYNKWYGNLSYLINWENNGKELKDFASHYPRNEKYYFLEGLTYTLVGGKFNARYLPQNCLFDLGGPSSFPSNPSEIFFILGYLNSSFVNYILEILNPTINTPLDDLKRLPYITPNDNFKDNISNLVLEIIKIKKELISFDITEWEHKKTAIEYAIDIVSNEVNLIKLYKIFKRYKESLILKFLLLEAETERNIFNLYDINNNDREKIFIENGFIPGFLPILQNFDKFPKNLELEELFSDIKEKIIDSNTLDILGKKIKELYEEENPSQIRDTLSYISLNLKINPVSIFNIINELDLFNISNFKLELKNFLTKIILNILKKEDSGIILLNQPSDKDILFKRVLAEFDHIFGEDNTDNVLKQINNLFGKSLNDWIEKDFFKNHISQYKKRPIVWHLSSELKSFQCFIFYHNLSQNLLIILRNRYVEKRLNFLKEESKYMTELLKNESEDSKIKELNKKYIKIEDTIEDLQKFSENLKKIIDMNIEFDEDNGVKQQILPFQKSNLLSINKVI